MNKENFVTDDSLTEKLMFVSHRIYKARELARKVFVLGVVNFICLVVAIVLMIIHL